MPLDLAKKYHSKEVEDYFNLHLNLQHQSNDPQNLDKTSEIHTPKSMKRQNDSLNSNIKNIEDKDLIFTVHSNNNTDNTNKKRPISDQEIE